MKKILKKIDAAMNDFYKMNGLEFNPYDDELEDKAIAYTAVALNMEVSDIIAYLDGAY